MTTAKRVLVIVLTMLCAFTFMLTGCSDTTSSVEVANLIETGDEVAPYKYDPPITVTACMMAYAMADYPDGDDSGSNVWTRAIERDTGVKLVWDFIGADASAYSAKINGALTTNSLPELMSLFTVLFFKVADAGKAAPINDYYDKYVADGLKEAYKNNNERGLKTVTRDGKILALPSPQIDGNGIGWDNGLCWYRQDWLDKLGLSMPTTMDEWWTLTETISTKMSTPKKEVFGFYMDSSLGAMVSVGNAYGAYSSIWIEDENGEIVRGETQDAWITPLKKLREAYKKGVIDPEFVNFDRSEASKTITNGQVGVLPVGHFAPDGWNNAVVAVDPEVRWTHDWLPSGIPGQEVLIQGDSRVSGFVCTSTTTAHPEVGCIVISYIHNQNTIGDPLLYNDGKRDVYRYVQSFLYSEPYAQINGQKACAEVIKGEKDPSELGGMALSYYKQMKPWLESKDPSGWPMYAIYGDEGSMIKVKERIEAGTVYSDRLWDEELPYWKQYGSDLATSFSTHFQMIICDVSGKSVEEDFQAWKDYFYTAGGDKCTQEMNDWWKAEGREGFYE